MEKLQQLNFELGTLLALTSALNAVVIPVSSNMSIQLSSVSRYEAVEEVENEKLTGKILYMLFFSSGDEIQLTDEQNRIFEAVWNQKAEIDNKLMSCAGALFTEFYAQPAQPLQLVPTPQNT
jgi:hypothetical protein